MNIGNLNLRGKVVAAPLAGISNRPFRVLSVKQGAALVYTEMVSSEGIIRNQKKTWELMEFKSDEQPLGVQIFGANPEVMKQAAEAVAERIKPDLIDINFGCPVKKVVNKNGGAAALKDMILAEDIICAVVEGAGDIPVTIKIRSGWDESHSVYIEAGQVAQRAGVQAITLHARTRSQGYSGSSDWTDIQRLKESVTICVIGNGDVVTPQDARRMLDQTGCDAVMIGRAAMGNPFVFNQMNRFLETGEDPGPPTVPERVDMARLHARLMTEEYGVGRGSKMMRKYFGWYLKGFKGASEYRVRLLEVASLADIDRILNEICDVFADE